MRTHHGKHKPLYRRVNTRTHGVHHGSGKAAKYERRTKSGAKTSMHSGQQHGLDYTPLYKFLLSRVGQKWDDVHAQIQGRVPTDDPIYHILAEHAEDARDIIRVGESSYFCGLIVDADGVLQRVNPDLVLDDLHPSCACCTHTFNGERFVHAWDDNPKMVRPT